MTPSKAITSLDAWLETAEEVLTEQREAALSPSQALGGETASQVTTVTLRAFEEGLSDLLGRLCAGPGRWILIAEDANHTHHFWQALCYEDGSLVTEVVSNHYLEDDDRLTADQEEELAALGWDPPALPGRPNWIRVCHTTSPPVDEVADLAVASIRRVFGMGNDDMVLVKMFSSPLRGDTPASPVYAADESVAPAVGPSAMGMHVRPHPATPAWIGWPRVDDSIEVCFGPIGTGGLPLIDPSGGPDEPDPEFFGDYPEADEEDCKHRSRSAAPTGRKRQHWWSEPTLRRNLRPELGLMA